MSYENWLDLSDNWSSTNQFILMIKMWISFLLMVFWWLAMFSGLATTLYLFFYNQTFNAIFLWLFAIGWMLFTFSLRMDTKIDHNVYWSVSSFMKIILMSIKYVLMLAIFWMYFMSSIAFLWNKEIDATKSKIPIGYGEIKIVQDVAKHKKSALDAYKDYYLKVKNFKF